ncbi:hypothetical protein BSY17_4021 (plasmid) [Sphingobium sp. RAC03]|nr:hypothetical protein BSY17_4021 [Sphingobium sp. RAC03]
MPAFKVAPDSFDNSEPTCVPLGHGYQSVTEPIAKRYMPTGVLDIWTGSAGRSRCLRDQVEDHIGITRTPRDGGEPFDHRR